MATSRASGRFCPKVLPHSLVRLLSNPIAEIFAASEHIKNMETAASAGAKAQIKAQQLSQQMDEMRRQMETMQNENYHLSQEMQHYREQTRPQTATAMHPQQPAHFPSPSTILGGDPSRSLPPLTNGTNGTAAASSSMQGVQYTEERR